MSGGGGRPSLLPRVRSTVKAWLRPPPQRDPRLMDLAMQATRSLTLAGALVVFMVGFTLDDVRSLRIPGYMLGSAAAILLVAFGPTWMGRRLLADRPHDSVGAFAVRAARVRRLSSLALLLVGLLFLAWLVVFSAGVPPWAA